MSIWLTPNPAWAIRSSPAALQVRHDRGEQLAAGAQADRADLLAAGDLADRVGGVQQRLRVGVQVPVGVLGGGVAPAGDEHLQSLADGVLDEAAVLGEVEDVVPVDDRPDDQQRHGPHRGGGGRELQDLQDLVAEHDLAGRRADVLADAERAGVHLARHPGVPDVPEQVASAADQARTTGVEGVLEGGGVPDEGVRRCEAAREDAGREAGPLTGAPVDVGVLDGVADRPLDRQVGLAEPAVERVRHPRRVGEPPVALVGGDRRAAEHRRGDLTGERRAAVEDAGGARERPQEGTGGAALLRLGLPGC